MMNTMRRYLPHIIGISLLIVGILIGFFGKRYRAEPRLQPLEQIAPPSFGTPLELETQQPL